MLWALSASRKDADEEQEGPRQKKIVQIFHVAAIPVMLRHPACDDGLHFLRPYGARSGGQPQVEGLQTTPFYRPLPAFAAAIAILLLSACSHQPQCLSLRSGLGSMVQHEFGAGDDGLEDALLFRLEGRRCR